MTQGKLIVVWIGAMLALGGVYGYTAWRANKDSCDCPSCKLIRSNPGGVSSLESALPLNSDMPVMHGRWLTMGEKAPDIRGKVLLLDFWGILCRPCVAAIPANNRLHDKYAPRGLVVAGVSQDPRAMLEDFGKSNEIKYPLLSSDRASFEAFQIQVTPSLFLYDKNGKLIWKGSAIDNPDGSANEAFEKILTAALAETENAQAVQANDAPPVAVPADFQKLLDKEKVIRDSKEPEEAVERGLKIGAPLPELKGYWLNSPPGTPDFKNKVLLIDFFTTVCGSCVASIPQNNAVYKKYQAKGFVFAFASPETKEVVEDFMIHFKTKIEYPVLTHATDLLEFCEIKEIPATLLFGRDGTLLWKGGMLEEDGKLGEGFEKILHEALSAK